MSKINNENSTSSSPITKKQALTTNKIIDFHINNGLKNEHISEVKKVKKVFITIGNNQIKDNKTEKQTIYANIDSSHTVTKNKDNNSNINNSNTNNNNNTDNIQDTITPNPSLNPSENEPPDQSTAEWKKGTTVNCGGLHDLRIERG